MAQGLYRYGLYPNGSRKETETEKHSFFRSEIKALQCSPCAMMTRKGLCLRIVHIGLHLYNILVVLALVRWSPGSFSVVGHTPVEKFIGHALRIILVVIHI